MALVSVCYAADYRDPLTGMEFVLVKGGCFQMGDVFGDGMADEMPTHEVCVDDFYIGKQVVTRSQFEKIAVVNPSSSNTCGPDCPAARVSWLDAELSISRLKRLSGKNYRLPYEAEWEYAARSGGKREKWAGTSNLYELEKYAWFEGDSDNKIHPVGSRRPNGLGLYDMSGNVWQWCNDWYDKDYYKKSPKENPHGPQQGYHRVIRGGSWADAASKLRTTNRRKSPPDARFDGNGGFRLVLPVK